MFIARGGEGIAELVGGGGGQSIAELVRGGGIGYSRVSKGGGGRV